MKQKAIGLALSIAGKITGAILLGNWLGGKMEAYYSIAPWGKIGLIFSLLGFVVYQTQKEIEKFYKDPNE